MTSPIRRINKNMMTVLQEARDILSEKSGENVPFTVVSGLAARDLQESDFLGRLRESLLKKPVTKRRKYALEFRL